MLQNNVEFSEALSEFKTVVEDAANNFAFNKGDTLRVVNIKYNNDESKGSCFIGVYVCFFGKTPVGGSFDKDLIRFYVHAFGKDIENILGKLEMRCVDMRALPDYDQNLTGNSGGCYWYQFA